MNIDTTFTSTLTLEQTMAREAAAAQHAITAESKETNVKQLAALSQGAEETQVAEHIRGMVAVTMAHVSINASAATRNTAGQWREWALGVADGVERGVPAAA